MNWEEIAWELLKAPSGDAVRLACMENPDPSGMDLTALVEFERKQGGGTRVKLMDRAAILAGILKADFSCQQDPAAADAFYAALEGAAGKGVG